MKMAIQYVIGDLFTSNDSLAHCVSRDLRMGKGIAVEFKRRFGQVDKLSSQTGNIAVLEDNGRYIYYLLTKDKCYHKPTYNSLRTSLVEMRDHMLIHGIITLAIPKIGCGLDGLSWDRVSDIIEKVFGNTDIVITVYSL